MFTPTLEEKAILDQKNPLNLQLKRCLAAKRTLTESIKKYENELFAQEKASVSVGASADTLFAHPPTFKSKLPESPSELLGAAVNDAAVAAAMV